MTKLIELNIDSNIVVSSTVKNYDKPDYIYIPIKPEYKLLIKQNSPVLIGTPIIDIDGSIITSTISGTVTSIKKVNTYSGISDAIEIMNDFKEKSSKEPKSKLSLKNLTKEEITEILNLFNIEIKDKNNLIINSVDDEPYVLTENFYLLLYYEGLLELLDKLAKVYNIENITICVKSTSSENISKLMDCLGMYPNITLNILPNLYLLGNKDVLIKHLGLNEDNTSVIKASTFYNIYNLIKRNRVLSNKLITISGNNIDSPSIVRVKIGTRLEDIFEYLNIKKEAIFIAGGLMSGSAINIQDFIITDDVDSILVMKPKKEKKPQACINCGACIDICPVNINPLLLDNSKYFDRVKDKCLNCGLCSYICPTYINFKEIIKGGTYE